MNVDGFRAALDRALTRRHDLDTGGAVYLPERLIDLNESCPDFFNEAERDEISECGDPYLVVQELALLPYRTLIDFDWTFEGPPSWDDRIELLELGRTRTYVWLPPNEDVGRGWLPLAAVEPPANTAAYDWLLGELWGASHSVFGPELDQNFLASLPTMTTITAPDRLSLSGVRAAIAMWLGDDPTSEKWGMLLDRVGRAVRFRGPGGKFREMQGALDAMESMAQRLQGESLASIVSSFKADEANASSRRSSLLSSTERRSQLIQMYLELCCRVASPNDVAG